MISKIYLVVFLVFFALVVKQSEAQDCVPKHVVNLTLDNFHFLSWAVQEDEECDIVNFMVEIFHQDHPVDYRFVIKETQLDVSFLHVCEEWVFVVIPIEANNPGAEQRLVSYIPIHSNADLAISSINITRAGPINEVHLAWDIIDKHLGSCTIQYRLTVELEDESHIEDMYLRENMVALRFLAPCANYQFGVRAINIAHPTIEGPISTATYYISPARQFRPRLIGVTPDQFGFNMTWQIQSAVRNKCRVSFFYVDGGVLFRQTVNIENDDRGPVNVSITGLNPDTMYFFEGMIHNTGGRSLPTQAAAQTLRAGRSTA